jgi:hypothetical protein
MLQTVAPIDKFSPRQIAKMHSAGYHALDVTKADAGELGDQPGRGAGSGRLDAGIRVEHAAPSPGRGLTASVIVTGMLELLPSGGLEDGSGGATNARLMLRISRLMFSTVVLKI